MIHPQNSDSHKYRRPETYLKRIWAKAKKVWHTYRDAVLPETPLNKISEFAHYCVIILILGAAIYLRIRYLTERIWHDELITLYTIDLSYLEILHYLRDYSVHPPLYYVLLKSWALAWGAEIMTLRMFSTIAGVVSIAYIMHISRSLFNRPTAYAIGILIAISPFHIYYSAEMRSYALFFLLILFSYTRFISFLQNPGSRKNSVLYVISILLLGYVHIYGLVVILTQLLHTAFFSYSTKSRPVFKKLIILQGFFVAGFLPWIPIFLKQVSHRHYWGWIPDTGWMTFRNIFFDFVNRSEWVLYFACIMLLISSIYLGRYKIMQRRAVNIASLLLWLIVPLIVALVLSLTTGSVLVSRYAQQVFFVYLLILSAGYGVGIKAMTKSWLKTVLPGMFIFFILIQIVDLSRNGVTLFRDREEGWVEVVSYYLNNRSRDDLLLAYTDMSPDQGFPTLRKLVGYYNITGHLNYCTLQQLGDKPEMQIEKFPFAWLVIFSFNDLDQDIEFVSTRYLKNYKLEEVFKNETHALFLLKKLSTP